MYDSCIKRVEKTVMQCVSRAYNIDEWDVGANIYNGKTKVRFYVSLVRSLCLIVLRDTIGLTHTEISNHSGLKINTIIHSISRTRGLLSVDKGIRDIYNEINKTLWETNNILKT